jgi:hypothetical protein
MKKLVTFLAMLFLAGNAFAFDGMSTPLRVPRPLTITATAISNTYAGTTKWVKLLDSGLGKCETFYVAEPGGVYNFYYTFNYLTYTVVDDYMLYTGKATPMDRSGYTPNGFWAKVTFTSVDADGAAAITLRYESWGSNAP